MKMKMTNEAKTGILVLVCVAVLVGVVLKVGNFKLFQSGYTIKSQFQFTSGVKIHAPVRLSGVDVGEVKDIDMLYGDQTAVELILWIQDGVKIRVDSIAYVTTLGLMGEKYVEIKAGTEAVEYAKPGDRIPSEEPVRLEDLIKMGTQIAGDIGKMAQDISKVAQSVDHTVQENKPKLNKIFDNLEETSWNFRDFSQDLKFHPWKVLARGKEKSRGEMDTEQMKEKARRMKLAGEMEQAAVEESVEAVKPAQGPKMNFASKR